MAVLAPPESLWSDGKIILPDSLVGALRDELRSRGLFDRACQEKPPKSVQGGEGEEESLDHFVFQFKSSAARLQLALLDPNGRFTPFPTRLAANLFDGRLSILDVPCGSGGGLFGLLCAVAELRRLGQLPRLPVEASIVAGDISTVAMDIHRAMLARVEGDLATQGVRVACTHVRWDVTDPFSTGQLLDHWLGTAASAERFLLFVSAFSGFAYKNQEVVTQAVRDITARFYSRPLFIAWLEPDIEQAKKYLPKLIERLANWFGWPKGDDETSVADDCLLAHPFNGSEFRVTGRVFKIDWPRR